MAVYTVRTNDEQQALIKNYSELTGTPISTLLRDALLEKIEDELDLQVGVHALANRSGDTISLQEMLDLEDD